MFPIKNKIKVPNKDYIGYGYYISDFSVLLTIRRFDETRGWDTIKVYIDDEEFSLEPSNISHKKYILTTKTPLIKDDLSYTQEIPKIIVQTSDKDHIDYHQRQLLDTLQELNPEYKYVFFNDSQRRKFIREFFSKNVMLAYDTLVPGAFKADFFRYCFIYIYGGCYLDYKTICLIPFREFIKKDDDYILCIGYEWSNSRDINVGTSYLNSVLISKPKNPLFLEAIEKCVENILIHQRNFVGAIMNYILDITGPTMLYEIFHNKIEDKSKHIRLKAIITGSEYSDFKIIELTTEKVLFYKTDKESEQRNQADKNHYGQLWTRGELFYLYKGMICNKDKEYFSMFIYPHMINHFSFYINDRMITINPLSDFVWESVKVKIINEQTNVSTIFVFTPDNKVFNV